MRNPHFAWRFALLAVSIAAVLVGITSLPQTIAAEPSSATYPEMSIQAEEPADFNWAKLHSAARIAYVSSGPKSLAFFMIDGDPRTVFRFSGADLHPTVIVELARDEQLHRVTAAFQAGNVKVNVFLLDALPKNLGDLGGAKGLKCVLDRMDAGKAGVDFDPSNARY